MATPVSFGNTLLPRTSPPSRRRPPPPSCLPTLITSPQSPSAEPPCSLLAKPPLKLPLRLPRRVSKARRLPPAPKTSSAAALPSIGNPASLQQASSPSPPGSSGQQQKRGPSSPSPGQRFRDFVLSNFYCSVVVASPSSAPLSPASLWVTCSCPSKLASADFVASALSFCLPTAAAPFVVCDCGSMVFQTYVANQNVANFLCAAGPQVIGEVSFVFFP